MLGGWVRGAGGARARAGEAEAGAGVGTVVDDVALTGDKRTWSGANEVRR